jgi:hypothetical protein
MHQCIIFFKQALSVSRPRELQVEYLRCEEAGEGHTSVHSPVFTLVSKSAESGLDGPYKTALNTG